LFVTGAAVLRSAIGGIGEVLVGAIVLHRLSLSPAPAGAAPLEDQIGLARHLRRLAPAEGSNADAHADGVASSSR
jgi:hypothetical protein